MPAMLRRGDGRVTQIELFFDLVYVFAVTQLSHFVVAHPGVEGSVEAAVLLAMVWQLWVYTTWMTNYLDPNRQAVRLALIVLMLASLAMSAAIPLAFASRGLLIAALYVLMQLGRSVFVIWAVSEHELRWVFYRILAWSVAGAVPMLCGVLVDGYARAGLWALTVAVELTGAAVGFATPGVGRSATSDWTIDGGHFAERCQAFVLIALGESIVVVGSTLSGLLDGSADAVRYVAFLVAFAGAVALWWVYFDRAAGDSAEQIENSPDPGRLARSAFHWVHPVIVAGVIVSAAADERLLEDPTAHGRMPVAWLVLGGTALFLGGHAVFKAIVWRVVSWQRVIGVAVLLALLVLAPHVTALTLGLAALAIVVAVSVADRLQHPATLTDPLPASTP